MINLIETRIKQLFKTDAAFCRDQGYSRNDFPSKKDTVESKFNWLNSFLKPLKLKVEIVDDESDLNNP